MALRRVNQLIVSENNAQRLIEGVCLQLTETLGYHNVWIALLGGQTAQNLGLPNVGPVATSASQGFDEGFDTLREGLERGEYPRCMSLAVANKQMLVVESPASDCHDCPLHDLYGERSGFVRDLTHAGVTYGILTASVPAPFAYDQEEQEFFNELADDLGFALHKIMEMNKFEENRQYLKLVIEGSGVGTWKWNVQTNETLFNDQWATMLGVHSQGTAALRLQNMDKFCPP